MLQMMLLKMTKVSYLYNNKVTYGYVSSTQIQQETVWLNLHL